MKERKSFFLSAGCKNCMNYKPDIGNFFKCQECGEKWQLANFFPGNYWEPVNGYTKKISAEDRIKQMARPEI